MLPVVAVLYITACNEENEVEIPAKLDIPQESLSFFEHGISFSATASDGVVTVKLAFTSSLSWSATIQDADDGKPITWLTVNPSSGSAGSTTITVTAQDNTSEEARKAKITVTCGSITQSVNVVQAGLKTSPQNKGLVISPAEVEIGKNEKIQLSVFDADGNPVKATWSSSNTLVASVDGNGQLESLNPGTAIITAQADGKSGTCQVTVHDEVPLESLTFDKTELSLNVGETYKLTPIFIPENASNKTIYRWASNAPQVASVSDDGLVTALAPGKALIRAGIDAQGSIMAECMVTVIDPNAVTITIESLTLDKSEATVSVNQAEPLFITATVTPQDVLEKTSVGWKSSNPTVVLVEAINKTQAKVVGLKAGKETVMAYIGDKTAICEVTVEGAPTVPVSGIYLNYASLELEEGASKTIIATVSPVYATDKIVIWSSSNTAVATVDDGTVTAVAEGEAVITAKAGDFDVTCYVTVKKAGPSVPIPEAVDLGLPSGLKWASFNVGASSPEESGDFYTWGGVEPHYSSLSQLTWKSGMTTGYTWSTYEWGKLYNQLTKYCDNVSDWVKGTSTFPDNKHSLDITDDAANVNLGGSWRMPTPTEKEELRKKCTWTYEVLNGVKGARVTGPNNNSIFLPAQAHSVVVVQWVETETELQSTRQELMVITGHRV